MVYRNSLWWHII